MSFSYSTSLASEETSRITNASVVAHDAGMRCHGDSKFSGFNLFPQAGSAANSQ
jgi:hypothetical protein